MKKNILITGIPRSGKSTLLKKIIKSCVNKVGFITNEVRENGERTGFQVETHAGENAMLASVIFQSAYKVSKYFVDVVSLNSIILKVKDFNKDDLLYLDEIGEMELFSEEFKDLVRKYLDSENICIATISKVYSNGFIEEIKDREDIEIIEITRENHPEKQKLIESMIDQLNNDQPFNSLCSLKVSNNKQ